MLERELYIESDGAEEARLLGGVGYVDADLTREEILRTSSSSDNYQNWQVRRSPDNGRTWSAPEPLAGVNVQLAGGGIATYPGAPFLDPISGVCYRAVMKRIWPGNELYTFDWATHEHPFHDHVFIQENDGPPLELHYEESPEHDSDHPFDEAFLFYNRAYRGQSVCFGAGGLVYHPMVCRPYDACYGLTNGGIVLMRREPDGRWLSSNRRFVSPEISSRGLLEPDAAVLADGRVLIVCRGSDTEHTEGRKWFTWSEDAGRTLAPVEEFRYSNGDRFYSPSSIHRFIRSNRNGLLYWIGNVCEDPPSGNNPRYPLCIAVVDEERPGIIRETMRVVDDRAPGEPESLSLSNFYLVEDRESLDLEIYMSRTADRRSAPDWISSVYRYRYTPE